MKRFILLLIILLSISPASAQVMKNLNYEIELKEDQTTDMHIYFEFTEEIKEIKIPLQFQITNIETNGGTCLVKENNVLSCKPPSRFMVGIIKINTKFQTEEIIQTKNNISYFHLDIPILWETENVNILVKLPFRTVLIDDKLRPLSPSGAEIGSDGRSVTLKWNIKNQKVGDVIPLRVRYELITPIENIIQTIGGFWFIAILILIALVIFLIFKRIEIRSHAVYSVLTEPERIIVDIISKQGKKEVDQKKLVKLSGFSKAKVSRTINSLVGRGIVDSVRIGRKNKISLKKRMHSSKYNDEKI